MIVTKEHEHKQNIGIKSDNRGFTLTEMLVTFALLGIFLVAVTRMISYTVTLYHETQGAALGMQVNDNGTASFFAVSFFADSFLSESFLSDFFLSVSFSATFFAGVFFVSFSVVSIAFFAIFPFLFYVL